jgi:hypothetical protein
MWPIAYEEPNCDSSEIIPAGEKLNVHINHNLEVRNLMLRWAMLQDLQPNTGNIP